VELTVYLQLALGLRVSGIILSIPYTLSWNGNKIIDLLCHYSTNNVNVCHLFINLPKAAITKSHSGL